MKPAWGGRATASRRAWLEESWLNCFSTLFIRMCRKSIGAHKHPALATRSIRLWHHPEDLEGQHLGSPSMFINSITAWQWKKLPSAWSHPLPGERFINPVFLCRIIFLLRKSGKTELHFWTKNVICWNRVLQTVESRGFKEISRLCNEPLPAPAGSYGIFYSGTHRGYLKAFFARAPRITSNKLPT